MPAPCAPTDSSAAGRALPTSDCFRSLARSSGRACARRAAAPATRAADALEPLTVPYAGEPSAFAPGSLVATATPAATRSGFTRPSKASPRDEKAATRCPGGRASERAGASETPTLRPATSAATSCCATASGSPTTGTGTRSSRPSAPDGSGAPWTSTAAAPACAAARTTPAVSVPEGTSAARPATRL